MGFVHPCFKYKFYITGTFSLLSQKYSGQRERFSFIIWRKQGLLPCAIACLQLWHSAFTLCSTSEAEMLVQQGFAVLKETERRTTVTSPTLPTKPYFTNLPIFSLLTFNFLYQIFIHMQAYQGWQIIIFHTFKRFYIFITSFNVERGGGGLNLTAVCVWCVCVCIYIYIFPVSMFIECLIIAREYSRNM